MHGDPGAARCLKHDAVGLGDFVHDNTDKSHGGAVAPATAPTNPSQQRGRARRGGGGDGGLSCGNCGRRGCCSRGSSVAVVHRNGGDKSGHESADERIHCRLLVMGSIARHSVTCVAAASEAGSNLLRGAARTVVERQQTADAERVAAADAHHLSESVRLGPLCASLQCHERAPHATGQAALQQACKASIRTGTRRGDGEPYASQVSVQSTDVQATGAAYT